MSSSKQEADSSSSTKKAKIDEPTMFADIDQKDDPVNKGYGLNNNITPLYSTNPWIKNKTVRIPYTIRSRKYIDLNYSEMQNKMYILPYLNLQFWSNGNSDTQNYNQAKQLSKIAMGIKYLQGRIKIDVHTVCRERLITQGATNVKTYDFETSQNLIVAHETRVPYIHKIKNTDKITTTPVATTDACWNNGQDMYTYEEIPQKHSWHYTVHIPQRQYRDGFFHYPGIEYANNQVIPHYDNLDQYMSTDNKTLLNQYMDKQYMNTVTWNDFNINTRNDYSAEYIPHHAIFLAQPSVADEQNTMKFRYQIMMETALDVEFLLYPDITTNLIEWWTNHRQILQIPTIELKSGTDFYIPYHPYNYQTS